MGQLLILRQSESVSRRTYWRSARNSNYHQIEPSHTLNKSLFSVR